eukprot:2063984-Ditylum_brightwellii.AAC.1
MSQMRSSTALEMCIKEAGFNGLPAKNWQINAGGNPYCLAVGATIPDLIVLVCHTMIKAQFH